MSLTGHSKFSSAQAWSLTTQLVFRIFNELHNVHDGVLLNIQPNNMDDICTNVLWTVFRTHDVMQEFAAKCFKDHDAISSEYIKFLATNSGYEELSSLLEQVKELKEEKQKMLAEFKSVSRKADSASALVDELKKTVAALTKKVEAKK